MTLNYVVHDDMPRINVRVRAWGGAQVRGGACVKVGFGMEIWIWIEKG